MGKGKKLVNAAIYTAMLFIALYSFGLFSGILWQFGELFSELGFIAVTAIIFTLTVGE